MERVMADCRHLESDSDCSMTIIGDEDEVVRMAAEHASTMHGRENTPELRKQMRSMLEPASTYAEARIAEPLHIA